MLLVFSIGGVFRSWRVAGEGMPEGAVLEAVVHEMGIDIVRGPGFDPTTHEPMYADYGLIPHLFLYYDKILHVKESIGPSMELREYCAFLHHKVIPLPRQDIYSRVDVHALGRAIAIDGYLAELRKFSREKKWVAFGHGSPQLARQRTTPGRALARARAEAIARGEWA